MLSALSLNSGPAIGDNLRYILTIITPNESCPASAHQTSLAHSTTALFASVWSFPVFQIFTPLRSSSRVCMQQKTNNIITPPHLPVCPYHFSPHPQINTLLFFPLHPRRINISISTRHNSTRTSKERKKYKQSCTRTRTRTSQGQGQRNETKSNGSRIKDQPDKHNAYNARKKRKEKKTTAQALVTEKGKK